MKVLVFLTNLLLCEALREQMIKEPAEWQIVAANNQETVACVKPDLVLVDFPNLDQRLFSEWPDAKFLLLDTGIPLQDTINLMRLYRLDGILSANADFQLLKRALRVIRSGQIWIDNTLLKALLRVTPSDAKNMELDRLTDREKQIAEKIAEGFRNREIAEKLFLSERTVKSHINHIFSKLGVTNRSQLVSLLLKNH